jgi:ABC-2 type transport system ATP-binding protein
MGETSGSSPPSAPLIVRELVKRYGSVTALNGVNLTVPAGSLYALLGPNGAGKSTLFRIMATLLDPDAGELLVAGISALAQPRLVRQHLGYVAQDTALDKVLTGREHLAFHGALQHLDRRDARQRSDALISLLDMGDWINRPTKGYSGGMRRRLELACGLLHAPTLLLLDEPTVGLDIESRLAIWHVLRELRDNGTTVVLSTHQLEEVEALADRVAVIDRGRVIAEGTPTDLKRCLGGERVTLRVREFSTAVEAEQVRQLLCDADGVRTVVVNPFQGYSLNLIVEHGAVIETLRHQLEQSSIPVFSLSQSLPSIDDVYLQVTGRSLDDADRQSLAKRDAKRERQEAMRA